MIKLVAALLMFVDHMGAVFYPSIIAFRIIGRLSMPLFAYCIARGFYHSNQHDTVKNYFVNMLIMALTAQLPFYLMTGSGWNIGFTWLLSLLLLTIITKVYASPRKRILSFIVTYTLIFILVEGNFFSVDYGIYGITLPLLFFFLINEEKETSVNFVLIILVAWTMDVFLSQGNMVQIFTVPSAFILTVGKRFDKKVKLPKWVFYAFYPAHMAGLLGIKLLIGV